MGELERSVGEHQKTLEMTCRLQTAMEEYQFWCDDAGSTIARVGKFSSECRSTEAVSVLHRQFEKFVWPTVPQQEERISQITELAVRLHGVEEGRRYTEKTVSKHSEMVESIRALSDGLLALEARLRMESLKNQQDDGQKEEEEDKDEDEETKKEKSLKGNRRKRKKKEQTDNRRSQEASDMHELKETGHTPELTAEHDGKEVPVKRQIAANRKPPLRKSCSLDAERQTESRATSSYCSTHTFNFPCSPLDTNRRVHNIHNQSQPAATEATPSPSVTGPSFSDIQREFGKDASRGSLSEAELHDVMMEDSLSNDEYDCASPDDMSLPPLAETPESIMIQSDVEEGYCFSSHSVHTNQYSRQSEGSGTGTGSGSGAVRQHRQSSRTDSCPTPPTSRHSSSRFRSESSSFVQSPLTVPAATLFTSTLCSILKTKKTSTANVCLGGPEPSFPSVSNPLDKGNSSDSCSKKDNEVPDKRSPSKTEPVLKEHVSQYNQPQRRTASPSMITQNDGTLQTDPQVAELNHIPAKLPEACKGPDPDCHKDKTPSQETRFLKISTTFPQIRTFICQKSRLLQSFPDTVDAVSKQQRDRSPFVEPSDSHCTLTQSSCNLRPQQEQFKSLPVIDPDKAFALSSSLPLLHQDRLQDTGILQSCKTGLHTNTTLPQNSNLSVSSLDSGSGLDQDVPSSQTSKEGSSMSANSKQTVYCQSSSLKSHTLKQSSSNLRSQQEQFKSLPVIDPDKAFAHSSSLPLLHQDRLQDTGILQSCKTGLHTNTTLPQNSNLSVSSLDSGSGLDQGLPSSRASKGSMPQSSNTVKDTVYCQPSPSSSHCTLTQVSSKLRSQKESTVSQGGSGAPEVHASTLPEPNSISNTFSNKHQTVYSLHEPLTSSCTQQCVHGPGITPAAPPLPQPEPQALAHLHVTPLSSPPHLLTPDHDPTICQPTAIREEIRRTPQIQGPSLPAPVPQAQAESLPQGKASHPGPPCFTRPLSRATVMEGSPVTLEVEVMALPEPTLTWCKEEEATAGISCENGKHFLFVPEASHSDGVQDQTVSSSDESWVQDQMVSSSEESWVQDQIVSSSDKSWVQDQIVSSSDESWVQDQIVSSSEESWVQDQMVSSSDESWVQDQTVSSSDESWVQDQIVSSSEESWVQDQMVSSSDRSWVQDQTVSSSDESWVQDQIVSSSEESWVQDQIVSSSEESWVQDQIVSSSDKSWVQDQIVSSSDKSWVQDQMVSSSDKSWVQDQMVSSSDRSWVQDQMVSSSDRSWVQDQIVSSSDKSWVQDQIVSSSDRSWVQDQIVSSSDRSWVQDQIVSSSDKSWVQDQIVSSSDRSWVQDQIVSSSEESWVQDQMVSSSDRSWVQDQTVSSSDKSWVQDQMVSSSDRSWVQDQIVSSSDRSWVQDQMVSSSEDLWLVSEVFHVLAVDWQSWLGTLCVLLWLLYLVLL
nr:probable GPI-anchored adhesin-like protein PGA55 [Pseudochaenichthys georgianus]